MKRRIHRNIPSIDDCESVAYRVKNHKSPIDKSLPLRYKQYCKRAADKAIPFELTVDEFNDIIASQCVYCGQDGYTIDRVSSKGGYTHDNIVPCCRMCNIMKYTYTKDEFLEHIKLICAHNQLVK